PRIGMAGQPITRWHPITTWQPITRALRGNRSHVASDHTPGKRSHMPNFEQLTDRQREVYEFIRGKIRGRGYGPTVREIGAQFGIASPNGVMCHLRALERK